MRKSQWKLEEELERALAIEYVKDYCREHNLSLQKLQTQRFALSANESISIAIIGGRGLPFHTIKLYFPVTLLFDKYTC